MKIVLLGVGRMGSEVEALASRLGHDIVLRLDVDSNPDGAGLSSEALDRGEVVIDFTWPDAVLTNLRRVAEAGLPMVEGTTGWYECLDEAREIIEASGTGFVYGANFSIGANLFAKLVERAAQLFDGFPEYDPYVLEHHHRGKVDTPSGTALRLAETVVSAMERKRGLQVGNPEGRISSDALHVASLRAGVAFGQHKVGFDGDADTVELTLTARGRQGLAHGALFAAERIRNRKGFFEFSELLVE